MYRLGHIAVCRILNDGAGRQAILRQTDAALLQVRADLLVLGAIEAVFFEQPRQRWFIPRLSLAAWQHDIEQGLHHAAQLRPGATGRAKLVQFSVAQR